MDKKIKVLCIPSDTSGCGFFRSKRPHEKLQELFGDEFDVTITMDFDWKNIGEVSKYDIIHVHKGLFQDMVGFRFALQYCKDNNIVVICDVDDYWDVGPHHPQHLTNKKQGIDKLIMENLKLVDYVTTTTPIFENVIKKYNPNTHVFVNAIDPTDEQFISKPEPNPSGRLRIGYIMGSSHQHDMEQMNGIVNKLGDYINKVQFVLCGYDLRGTMRIIQPDGSIQQRPIKPEESVWYSYEKTVTNNYNSVSPEYKDFLLKFLPNVDWPNYQDEAYRRCWTKDISCYATHYNGIDVLLAPLAETDFNKCKSELKLIESGFFNKAVICSNFGPYTIGTRNMFPGNGVTDMEGNVILVDNSRAHKDWVKAIKKLVDNPELVEALRTNLHNSIVDKYNLDNVTKERAEWYKSIVKR